MASKAAAPEGGSHLEHHFPLLCLPSVPLMLVWEACTPECRQALWKTCMAIRSHQGIASTATWVVKCSQDARSYTLNSPSLRVESLTHARLVMHLENLPSTSIERFFKHTGSRHLQATMRALLRDLASRTALSSVTHVTLKSWDLDDGHVSATAQLIMQLFPSVRVLDLTTCVVNCSLLHCMEACTRPRVSSGGGTRPILPVTTSPTTTPSTHTRKLVAQLPVTASLHWQSACPSMVLEIPSTLSPHHPGSPPQWALSPLRPEARGQELWA